VTVCLATEEFAVEVHFNRMHRAFAKLDPRKFFINTKWILFGTGDLAFVHSAWFKGCAVTG
jgi:hypothetical protein